jgi:hypothetical protein
MLEDTVGELDSFRATVQKAADFAVEGWKLLNEAIGEDADSHRYASPRQTAPF